MSPNLIFNLEIEPVQFMWNGIPVTLSGHYELLPDNQCRYLHKTVMAVAKDARKKIPFQGRVIGEAIFHKERIYLIETERGTIERCRKPEVIE